jgi:predicted RNA-binding Zn-ribbon protein involved in translation (DUF1610 family)
MQQITKGLIQVVENPPIMEVYLCGRKMPMTIYNASQGEPIWMLEFDDDLEKFLQKNYCALKDSHNSIGDLGVAHYTAPTTEEVARYFVRLLTEHIVLHCRKCGGTNLHQVWDSRKFYPAFICQFCGEKTPPLR